MFSGLTCAAPAAFVAFGDLSLPSAIGRPLLAVAPLPLGRILLDYAPWLIAMVVLVVLSGFFSLSESALFYLGPRERHRLRQGNRAQRLAVSLLDDPDRLLTAVLFWNLLVNLTYFTLSSIATLQMQRGGHGAEAGTFAVLTVLLLIIFGEMVPKTVGVLWSAPLVSLLGTPLAAVVRLLDSLLPAFRLANLLSRRVLWPKFQPEPYLQVTDLERAVEFSTSDATLLEHEHIVLRGIVSLSGIRVDELMRPRPRLRVFRVPLALADLEREQPASGYLLTAEPDSDEVSGSIRLADLSTVPPDHLERLAQPVVYVPWCTTVADALETLQRHGRQVAAVINEFGETIGILTIDDILDTISSPTASRSERLLKRLPIRQVAPGVWQVTGMTSLRRLVRHFDVERPPSKSVTVDGVIQEILERFPEPGDRCHWGPFAFHVLESPDNGPSLVELTLVDETRQEE
jgi:CBS domain containing-hemolysin-like protein